MWYYIKKDCQNENKERLFTQSKLPSPAFGSDPKAGNGVGSFRVHRSKVCRCAVIGDCRHGEVGDGLTRGGHLTDCFGEHIWHPVVAPGQKKGQKLRKLAVIDQILTLLGQLLKRLWIGSLDWLRQKFRIRVLLPHYVYVYI